MNGAVQIRSPIPPDELDWGRECAEAGDTLAEIAEASGRPAEDWAAALGRIGAQARKPIEGSRLPDRDRRVAEMYLDGATYREIGAELGFSHQWAWLLVERLKREGYLRGRPRPNALDGPPESRARASERLRLRAAEGGAQYLPERNLAILTTVAARKTYSEVAREFGVSRSVVAGVVHRAKLRRLARETSP